jgi:hypothetical protein
MTATRRLAATLAADVVGHPGSCATQLRDSLDLVFEVEEQRLKKIVRPVHVYYP